MPLLHCVLGRLLGTFWNPVTANVYDGDSGSRKSLGPSVFKFRPLEAKASGGMVGEVLNRC